MITKKEIIEIMRDINQFEFKTWGEYYKEVAKVIIKDLKEGEKQGFDLATVWQHEYFKLKKILETKGLGKYIKSITLSGTAKGQEVRNDN